MTTLEVGQRLVELCSRGEDEAAIETLYARDVVSVEAATMPDMPSEVRGLEAVTAKGAWFSENHIVHSVTADGPYPLRDRFIVKLSYDLTTKHDGKRTRMEEMALYTVANGKIVREEFFYRTD